ncbi:MAG: hypothetical protein IMZ55_04910 [Acidobacteria bacterium]|nr:hypothetical protein [Acidobacteriota bacterium]
MPALTRQQIHIESNNWMQSDVDGGTSKFGETVWVPLGRRPGRWSGVQLAGMIETGVGVTCREITTVVEGIFRPGKYYHCASADGGHFGEMANNSMAGSQVSGFRYAHGSSIGDYVEFRNIPAGTTGLYVFGIPTAGNDPAVAVTVTNGTRVTGMETIDCTNTGDWAGITNPLYPTLMAGALLVATDFTAEGSVKIEKTTADATAVKIIGAIAVGEGESDPANGVIDPITCAKLRYNSQSAPGPIQLKALAETTSPATGALGVGARWFGEGGHFTSTYGGATNAGNITGETETRTYDDDQAWTPVNDIWVEQTAAVYRRVLTGVIATAATDNQADLGVFRSILTISPSGVRIVTPVIWNANAETEDIQVLTSGYAGQYSLPLGWNRIRVLPADSAPVTYAPDGTKTAMATYAAEAVMAVHGDTAILFRASSNQGGGDFLVWDYTGIGFIKLYKNFSAADQNVAAGDISFSMQEWVITDRGGFEAALSRRQA